MSHSNARSEVISIVEAINAGFSWGVEVLQINSDCGFELVNSGNDLVLVKLLYFEKSLEASTHIVKGFDAEDVFSVFRGCVGAIIILLDELPANFLVPSVVYASTIVVIGKPALFTGKLLHFRAMVGQFRGVFLNDKRRFRFWNVQKD